jgi:multiple sugar transport system substrate-binding protein
MIPVIYKSTDNMMIQMLKQKDAGYSTESGEVEMFNSSTKQILKDIASQVKKGSFSTFKISSYPANFLNAGECIFAIDSTAGATWMGSDAPLVDIDESRLVEFDTEVMTVPQYDTENPTMISQGPSVCIFNKEDNERVLASWLFVQYLLTNSIQIAYATTEGYAPVTTKAQESAEYKDYLSRQGQDGDYYYDVKLRATKLLLENTDNTFVTPVFNGSASLRDAAGYMIETVTKEVRRGKTANIDKIFTDATSLYRLDAIAGENKALGALPAESVALMVTLSLAWIGIGSYFVYTKIKEKKRKKI